MTHKESKDEYKHLAPYYDTLVEPILLKVRRAVCRLAIEEGFRDVLDVCCGTGRQAVMLAALGLRVSGVDLSPAMLDVALKKSPGSVKYYLGDASRLYFRDSSFDGAIVSFALHEKPPETRHAMLKEMQRILRPGGKIIIVDYLSPDAVVSRMAHLMVNLVERMAGESHHGFYQIYMGTGGLQGFIAREGLQIVRMQKYYMGSTGVVLLEIRGAGP